ncbi:coenzyme F420-0:L-glutamate ligase [Phytoactinopolyspora halophila]|uniref:coenzyme F420-0:L-glutamate ligase n=1 Tax=Phytoactinopolyspora halophila TaxID=1981511 RepID=UPI001B8B541A|nr:coenzyme F420-0:L-glutamate ligase [Phytoactinopolyspora halophila]
MNSIPRFDVWGVPGIPEVRPGDDLVGLLAKALEDLERAPGDHTSGDRPAPPQLSDGDVVVVTSKIVSKAEGRITAGTDREAAIDAEAVRTVSEWTSPRGRTRIVETRHGFVMAAAGVDASNVEAGTVALLPVDPDASARRIRDGLRARFGVRVGVILTDTAGRAWRDGVVDMAVGAAGIRALDDLRGQVDQYGNDLGMTVVAVADELASASELVRSKLAGVPVAVVRGLAHVVLPDHVDESGEPDRGASVLVRPSSEDRFRLGTPEAMREAVVSRRTVREFSSAPVEPAIVHRAVAAALTAPVPATGTTDAQSPSTEPPLRVVSVETGAARQALVRALREPGTEEHVSADLVASAPLVMVPCLLEGPAGAQVPDAARMLGAGAAVENLLITLAADGIGATWLLPPGAVESAVPTALALPGGWRPVGVVVAGYPAVAPAEHPGYPVNDVVTVR